MQERLFCFIRPARVKRPREVYVFTKQEAEVRLEYFDGFQLCEIVPASFNEVTEMVPTQKKVII